VPFQATFIHRGSVWVAERTRDGWIALYRFEAEEGYPLLAELRVLPSPDFHAILAAGVDEAGGLPAEVSLDDLEPISVAALKRLVDGSLRPGAPPVGGLTSRRLRAFRAGEAQEQARRLADFGVNSGGLTATRREDDKRGSGLAGFVVDDLGYAADAVQEPRRPGRRGHEDAYYAEFAAQYVAALGLGSSKPVVDVAKGRGESPAYVRDVIHEARRRRLLTAAPRGKSGGRLTDKALTALQGALETRSKG